MSHTRLCPLASIEALVFCRIMGYGSEFPVCLYADSDFCRLPRYLTKPRQRRSEWDMAGSDGISRVSTVFRGKSLLTNKMRII